MQTVTKDDLSEILRRDVAAMRVKRDALKPPVNPYKSRRKLKKKKG